MRFFLKIVEFGKKRRVNTEIRSNLNVKPVVEENYGLDIYVEWNLAELLRKSIEPMLTGSEDDSKINGKMK